MEIVTRKRGNCDALQLETARPLLLSFNYEAHITFEVGQPIHSRLTTFLLLRYAVTLTFDPSTFTCLIYRV